jgi:uncharacterized membrane protein
LPERSWFLFGRSFTYPLGEIEPLAGTTHLALRQFVGNPDMGWKVAWSDRMISLYGGIWVAGMLYALLRKRLPRLSPVVWLFLGVLPLALDGLSHMINDALAGVSGIGYRDTNAWLQFLTGNVFPATFYAGDAFGSFNNLMRLVTGLLFGVLTVWFLYPIVDRAMKEIEIATIQRLSTPRAQQLGFSVSRELTQKG